MTAVTSKMCRMVLLYTLILSMVSLPTSLPKHLLVETADKGGDDYEETPEFLRQVFKQIDLDSDMALSRDEISSYLKQEVETMAYAGGEQGEDARRIIEDQDKVVEEMFAIVDKDNDGLISHEEFSEPKHDEL